MGGEGLAVVEGGRREGKGKEEKEGGEGREGGGKSTAAVVAEVGVG